MPRVPTAADAPRTVVVLPTLNEADNIETVLKRLRALPLEIDVLVVDDASPDGTAARAAAIGAERGGVEVLERVSARGLGSAYRAGFERVLAEEYDVIVSMDADLSHDPDLLVGIVASLGAHDRPAVVIGSRYVTDGSVTNWPWHRRLLSRWGNAYTARALRLPIRDCTSGYRAYTSQALRAIDVGTTSAEGYAFLTEVTRRIVRAGVPVVEVPITFVDRERGRSKMSWRIVVESMVLVTRMAIDDRLGSWRGRTGGRGRQR